ncbi:MAG: LysR family transcriptional regulator [Opitutaceae bacterium]|nr:LysR family transcriptional regulator [Opitutaceae bacterium]
MNVHHLELFYYVAKHGGISAAVRNIPYGIQQPAVSGQMGQLEDALGVRLFERSPFRLTAPGARLFAHVQPFFEGLAGVAEKIREAAAPRLRVGAAELIIREHLHSVVDRLRAHHPGMKLALRSGFTVELEAWLRDGAIDLAITPLEGRAPARLNCVRMLRMLRMPLVLVVPRDSKLKSADELWVRKEITEPLVSVPPTEAISRLFRKGLQHRRVIWPPAIEASSLELVARYVERGYGLGVSVALPEIVRHPGVRTLPLEGFDPVEVAILWRGEATPLIRLVLEESRRYALELWPDWLCEPGIK